MITRRHTASLFLALSLTGCSMLSGLQMPKVGDATSAGKPKPGESTPESRKKMAEVYENNLKQCQDKTEQTNQKLNALIDKMGTPRAAMGSKPMSLTDALTELKKQKVTITVQNVGSPEMPTLLLKDSLMEEGQKIQGQPQAKMMAFAKRMQAAQPSLTIVREDLQAVNEAMGSSFGSTLSCNQYAKALTTTMGAMENGDDSHIDELLPLLAKYLTAASRSKSVVAASIASVGVIEAVLATTPKDPTAVSTLLDGIKKMKDTTEEVTDDQAKQAYQAAGQGLFDACHEQMEKSYADHPEMKRPDVDPCSKEGSRVKGSPSEEKARAAAADGKGGGGSLQDEAIKRLVPRDTPLADAADALSAISKGDYLGALKNAAKLAGRVTPFGGVISSVLGMFG